MFLTLMVVGLAGLLVMALPAFARHGSPGAAGGILRAGHVAKVGALHGASAALKGTAALKGAAAKAAGQAVAGKAGDAANAATGGLTRFFPSPRLIFSLCALYGAFGNALERAAHLSTLEAALVALVPAVAVERFAVTPLWNLLFRFQGQPSSPLEELVLSEARAVTRFNGGRGMVSVVKDGRHVQLSARLVDTQAAMPVRVGDRLRVEDVDARRERLTVSVPED